LDICLHILLGDHQTWTSTAEKENCGARRCNWWSSNGNMREDLRREGGHHNNNHDSLVDAIGSLKSPPFQTIGSRRGGRQEGPRERKHRSSRINTRTALLSILAAAPAVMAQNCISLSSSTQCSAFQSSSISTDSTLVGFLYVVVLLECKNI